MEPTTENKEPNWGELYAETHNCEEFVRVAEGMGADPEEAREVWHEINWKYQNMSR